MTFTVKDLIEALEGCPPDMPVVVDTTSGWLPVNGVSGPHTHINFSRFATYSSEVMTLTVEED